MSRAPAAAVALLLDAALREPPARAHPVVAAGAYLRVAARAVPPHPPTLAVLTGGAAWAVGALGAAAAGAALDRSLPRSLPLRAVLEGAALWPLLAARMLLEEVAAVERDLREDLDAGRRTAARIVSRDTRGLSAPEVRAAALSSLAENLSDSVVAPLLWHAVGGLPAAAAYRFANTADAAWGYRTPRWLHAGRVAARADDVANLVPARLTAGLLLAGAPAPLWRRLPGEAARTPSPNAGWPMAALALRLDRRLVKPGAYELHPAGSDPAPPDVAAALALARRAVVLGALLAAALPSAVGSAACRR